jgi:hypothetical protein
MVGLNAWAPNATGGIGHRDDPRNGDRDATPLGNFASKLPTAIRGVQPKTTGPLRAIV